MDDTIMLLRRCHATRGAPPCCHATMLAALFADARSSAYAPLLRHKRCRRNTPPPLYATLHAYERWRRRRDTLFDCCHALEAPPHVRRRHKEPAYAEKRHARCAPCAMRGWQMSRETCAIFICYVIRQPLYIYDKRQEYSNHVASSAEYMVLNQPNRHKT